MEQVVRKTEASADVTRVVISGVETDAFPNKGVTIQCRESTIDGLQNLKFAIEFSDLAWMLHSGPRAGEAKPGFVIEVKHGRKSDGVNYFNSAEASVCEQEAAGSFSTKKVFMRTEEKYEIWLGILRSDHDPLTKLFDVADTLRRDQIERLHKADIRTISSISENMLLADKVARLATVALRREQASLPSLPVRK